MPAVPKKKSTRGRTGRRRGANMLSLPNVSFCPSCKKPKRPHIVCPHCGYNYKTGSK